MATRRSTKEQREAEKAAAVEHARKLARHPLFQAFIMRAGNEQYVSRVRAEAIGVRVEFQALHPTIAMDMLDVLEKYRQPQKLVHPDIACNCSFCGVSDSESLALIPGPEDVAICETCLFISLRTLRTLLYVREMAPRPPGTLSVAVPKKKDLVRIREDWAKTWPEVKKLHDAIMGDENIDDIRKDIEDSRQRIVSKIDAIEGKRQTHEQAKKNAERRKKRAKQNAARDRKRGQKGPTRAR